MTERIFALKKDPVDLRDYTFKSDFIKNLLPEKVDMRAKMPPVVDQSKLGSCTANAIVSGLRQFLRIKHREPNTILSRLYLYWHMREVEGTLGKDAGSNIRDGMKLLSKIGVCPEKDFPYVISTYNDKPSAEAEAHAADYKIKEYCRIPDLTMLKVAVAEGYPVVFGFQVYSSFKSDEVTQTGRVPLPQEGEELLGGHAVLAVGYDDFDEVVICRNSWGRQWGDHGYFYLPYDFWAYNLHHDMWTAKK
jgi:C1A family cysteine protease